MLGFLGKFNFYFQIGTNRYIALMRKLSSSKSFIVFIIIGFSIGIFFMSKMAPSGFVPGEDQGMIYAVIQTPPGSTIEKTNDVARRLQEEVMKIEGVDSVASLARYEILTEGEGSNAGTCLISLKDWSERKNSVHDVMEELKKRKGLAHKMQTPRLFLRAEA